ncbi:proline-rich protein 36-like [Poecile atricapillus]|uniref:proline-rich protein 36-like n=1 Tax=Poecile atricapillus TaxID=48891 RepID=UPI002738D001|nr:proline-rich protein 36-like [Poecile atricapillus]
MLPGGRGKRWGKGGGGWEAGKGGRGDPPSPVPSRPLAPACRRGSGRCPPCRLLLLLLPPPHRDRRGPSPIHPSASASRAQAQGYSPPPLPSPPPAPCPAGSRRSARPRHRSRRGGPERRGGGALLPLSRAGSRTPQAAPQPAGSAAQESSLREGGERGYSTPRAQGRGEVGGGPHSSGTTLPPFAPSAACDAVQPWPVRTGLLSATELRRRPSGSTKAPIPIPILIPIPLLLLEWAVMPEYRPGGGRQQAGWQNEVMVLSPGVQTEEQ